MASFFTAQTFSQMIEDKILPTYQLFKEESWWMNTADEWMEALVNEHKRWMNVSYVEWIQQMSECKLNGSLILIMNGEKTYVLEKY